MRLFRAFRSEPHLRIPPGALEVGGHPFQQAEGDLLGFGGLAEDRQRGEGFRVEVPRLEDGNHLGRQPFHLGGVPSLRIDRRQVERYEGGVEADPTLDESVPRLSQGCLRLVQPAAPEGDPALQPAEQDEIDLFPKTEI